MRAHVLIHTDFPLLALVTDAEIHALSPERAAPALALRHTCRRFLLDVVEDGVARGDFAVPDVLLAAGAISAMGVRVPAWFGPDQAFTRERVARDHAEVALRVVGASAPPRS